MATKRYYLNNVKGTEKYYLSINESHVRINGIVACSVDVFKDLCKVIIGYKSLYERFNNQKKLIVPKTEINDTHHGNHFKAIIKDIVVIGRISRENGRTFFCTNERELNGRDCYEKFNHNYSWILDTSVSTDVSILSVPNELLIEYNAACEIISKFTFNSYRISPNIEHFNVGCNKFMISDLEKIYFDIFPEKSILNDLLELESKLTSLIEKIKKETELKEVIKSDPTKPIRDSKGRFIKSK